MNWISVKDRLPEKEGFYFVYAPSQDPNKPFFNAAWFHTDQEFTWSIIPRVWADAITHWMQPEVPKKEDEWHYVHVYHSFSGEQKVDCERKFSVTSHYCTPCKFYGVCVTKEFPVFSQPLLG